MQELGLTMSNQIAQTVADMTTQGQTAVDNFSTAVAENATTDETKNNINTLNETTQEALEELLSDMTKNGKTAVTNFSKKFAYTAKSASVKSQIQTLNTTITSTITPLINQMVNIGNQVALGVAEGIKQKINVVRKSIEELIRLTVKQAKISADIHSPSRVMRDEVGKNLALSVAEGITDNSKSVTTAMTGTLDKLTNLDFNPVTFGRKLNNTFSVSTSSNPIMDLLDIVSYYMPRLIEASKHSIVLDSGILVGETIGDIDNKLSQIYSFRARGV